MRSFRLSVCTLSVLAVSAGGCSLKPDTSVRLEIDLRPHASASGAREMPGSQFLHEPGFGPSEATFPTLPSEFGCYAVNVYGLGLGSPWQKGPGFDFDHPTKCRFMGVTSEILSGSGTFSTELSVPSGPRRVVQVLGLYHPDGSSCTYAGQDLRDAIMGPNYGDKPQVFQLGVAVADLFEDTTVTISSSYDYYDPLEAFGGCGYKPILQIVSGDAHTCVLVEDRTRMDPPLSGIFRSSGSVYCFGHNANGQLGDGTTTSRNRPVRVMTGAGEPLTNVVAIGAGGDHTCAIRREFALSQDTLYCWGSNTFGQLGLGDRDNRVYATAHAGYYPSIDSVDGGLHHTCYTAGSQTYCMGLDDMGQVGDGDPPNTTCAGASCQLSPAVVAGAGGGQVAVGDKFSCVAGGNAISCWGQGNEGQLGNGVPSNSPTPVSVLGLNGDAIRHFAAGSHHACAVTGDSWTPPADPPATNLFCWGRSSDGQVGTGGDPPPATTAQASLVSVPSTGYPQSLAAGMDHTCLSTTTGTYCWGANINGQLGFNSAMETAPSVVPGIPGAQWLTASIGYTCGIFMSETSEVKCWGSNSYGQHGNGGTNSTSTPRSSGIKFTY